MVARTAVSLGRRARDTPRRPPPGVGVRGTDLRRRRPRPARRRPVTTVETRAVVDLLGVLAYAELTAFDRLAEDARLAPTLAGRAALARMAAAEIGHHERLTARLRELGVDA